MRAADLSKVVAQAIGDPVSGCMGQTYEYNHGLLCECGYRIYSPGEVKHHAPYALHIKTAWELVQHMREKHHLGVLTLCSPTDDCKNWRAIFTKKHPEDLDTYPDRHAQGDTAPEAICRAALIALGVEI